MPTSVPHRPLYRWAAKLRRKALPASRIRSTRRGIGCAITRSSCRVQAKRPEALKAWLGPGIWQPECAEPCRPCNRFRSPSRIDLEVIRCCRNREVAAVVEDHQPSRAHQLAQIEQVHEYVVK